MGEIIYQLVQDFSTTHSSLISICAFISLPPLKTSTQMGWTQVAPPGAPRELPKAKAREKKWWKSLSYPSPVKLNAPNLGPQNE